MSVNKSNFASNSTTEWGSGIFNRGNGILTVTNSAFNGNSSTRFGFGGGGIFNQGTLNVTNSTFHGNGSTVFGFGGGIWNINGTLGIANSTFSNNNAGSGGGIENDAGALTVTNSTFADNFEGGISSGGTLTVTNSTFFRNSGVADAAIGARGQAVVSNSTFLANQAGGAGEGILSGVNLKGALLAANAVDNCGSAIIDVGYNLSDDDSCGFTESTSANNVTDAELNLDPNALQDNGGPTQTIALEAGSVAINQIPVADCTDQSSPPVRLLTDQRGVLRPQFTACDIGAYEYDTARSLKTNVLNILPSLTGGNRADQQALKVASSNLALAVRYYWSGNSGNELNSVLGRLNFLAEGRAVNALAGTLIPSSLLPPATIENYILNILIADRTLAVTAIAAAGGDSDATALVTQGDTQTAADQYSQALKSYQQAWSLAVSYVQ